MATDDEIGNLTASNPESEDLELAKDPCDPIRTRARTKCVIFASNVIWDGSTLHLL